VAEFPPITLRIDVLPSAAGGVSTVGPDDDVQLAITKMVADNYSQLAVLDENGLLRGAISWESEAKSARIMACRYDRLSPRGV